MTNELEVRAIQSGGDNLPAHNMMATIERIIMAPDVPIDRITALMDMQERQLNKVAEQEFNRAFSAAMSEMKPARKSGLNKHTSQRYSTLSDIIEAARPALSAHGLALNWRTKTESGILTVTAIVRHHGGWKEENSMSAPSEAGKGQGAAMNLIQSHGSTETYLKRYTGLSILGMSSDDFEDDGNASGGTITEEQYRILSDLIDKTQTDEVKFLEAYGFKAADQATLCEFPSKDFTAAKSLLERKLQKMRDQ